MKIKTAELTGAALDWAVAKASGVEHRYRHTTGGDYNGNTVTVYRRFSTDWSQGGPIIERERIDIEYDLGDKCWNARWHGSNEWTFYQADTPLIAAMRCFVASKLGDEVDVPEELV